MTDLTIPTAEELDDFADNATDDFGTAVKEQAILQAMDLLWLATGVTEQPTDARISRIVAWGILDMAWSLLIKTEAKTEINSPFSSERIGSYSYQKGRQLLTKGLPSGIEWFDTVVALLKGLDEAASMVSTEHVFSTPYVRETWNPAEWTHDGGGSVWWS